jgi:TPR repeat protein
MVRNDLKLMSCAVTVLLALALTGCAKQVSVAQDAAPESCGGAGQGLAAAPSPATMAAMAAHDAASQLTVAELHERVGRGDVAAQVELGLRYANGTGVEVNGERAVSLFATAHRQGNPIGSFFLGTAYSNGLGVPKDETVTVIYLEEAARQGYPVAQYWLGLMIAGSRGGVSGSWCGAVPLFEAAALQDISQAALQLGIIYHEGLAGDPDYNMAALWYRKATAKTLNQMAQYNLRKLIESYLVTWQEGDPGKPPPPQGQVGAQDPGPSSPRNESSS